MLFQDIVGQEHLKSHLQTSANEGRIAHAQLFCGKNGSGTLPMAIAYARHLLCGVNNPNENACSKMLDSLSHPDLHFVFPVNTTNSVKNPLSSSFLTEWREFLNENAYASLFEWYQKLGIDNKQGVIAVKEALEIVQKISLKSYEGGYKVMIIWRADKMNTETSNKLLKLIEEPPEKTVFILIAEDSEQVLQTISSRCQILQFPPLGAAAISKALQQKKDINSVESEKIAQRAQGDFNNALQLLKSDSSDLKFEEWIIIWVRSAFKAKGNKSVVNELIEWSEGIAANGREVQKQFLNYCIEFFRQALLINYKSESLVYLEPKYKNFDLQKFAPFVHGANITSIFEALEEALYHIERNGNAKIIFTDLSIKLTRFLHIKAE